MSTLHGSISKLTENSKVLFDTLGHVSSNIANYNTNGYKAQRFETYMMPGGVVHGAVRTDQSAGALMATFRELDIGGEGMGIIPVTNKQGEVAYSRGGSLGVNSEGYLVSGGKWLVGGGIKLPANYDKIKIKPNGTVLTLDSKENTFKEIGKIPLVNFKNPEELEIKEGNIVKPTEESGKAELVLDHSKIKQGKIEKSNVDAYALINETLRINASVLASSKFIKALDNIYRESISLR